MNVVGHYDKSTNPPFRRLTPSPKDDIHRISTCQNWFAVGGAHSDENDGGLLQCLNDRWMSRMPS